MTSICAAYFILLFTALNGRLPKYEFRRGEGAASGFGRSVSHMRIMVLTDAFLPHAGGSRVYYHNLYKNLVAQFPDQVTILTKKVPGWKEFDQRESTDSFRIVRHFKPLPNWKVYQLPKIIFPFSRALRQARSNNVDLIHVGDLYPPGVIALALKRLLGIPYVAYCHGEEITQTDQRRYQPIVRNRIYQQADLVIAACEFARRNLLRIGVPEGQVVKITPGVDCKRFSSRVPSPDLVRQFSLYGKKVLLTISRLCPRKGHDVVLKAIAKIHPEVRDLRYLIVGEGAEEAKLRQLAFDLGLADVVTFVGYVPDSRLPEFYATCDIFVMANREEKGDVEGFGMVFLEANASGKIVIGGRSGGTTDSILDGITGFLVKPGDADELAATLKRVLLNPGLRMELGEAGSRRARREFDWATRARQVREISSQILQHSRIHPIPGGIPTSPSPL